jgi:parvulin-like peptidyl-prolyl isomerase
MAGMIRAEDAPVPVRHSSENDGGVASGSFGQGAEEALEDLEVLEVDEPIVEVVDEQSEPEFADENIVDEEFEEELPVSASGSFGQAEEVEEPEVIELIDSIVAIVYGPERTRIICDSELRRMGIDGRRRTLPDIILEELMYQQTIKYKIPVDESAIDKYLLDIRRKNNLSLEQVKEIFKRSGYTYQEGREQLAMMYASSTMVELKIMQRLGVTEQEVIAFYEANPIYKEAKYQLERSFIPYKSSISHDEQKMMIERDIIKKGKASELQWGTPFWLKESELSEVMEFVNSMNIGDVSVPLEDSDGFEMYRLTAKRDRCVVSLEKRFREISDILKMPKYQQEMEKYRDELLAAAHIVYLIEKPISEPTEF